MNTIYSFPIEPANESGEEAGSSSDEFYDAEDIPSVIEVVTSPSVSIPTIGDSSGTN